MRKTIASITGATILFLRSPSSFWPRICKSTSTGSACRPPISAAASASRSPAIRRWPSARWPRRKAGGRPVKVGRDALRTHHFERARQRADFSRHARCPRQEWRHHRDRLAPHRRLRRLSALRAAGLRHLVAGFSGRLSLQKCAHRFLASGHQQMSGRPQSRILPHAASVVSGARGGYLRPQVGNSGRRDASAQLHSHRRISLHHAQRMRLRLGKLSENARGRQTANRLGRMEKEAGTRLAKKGA